jgi:hypothetical protein
MEVNGYLHAQAALSLEEHPSVLGKSIKKVILLLKYVKLLPSSWTAVPSSLRLSKTLNVENLFCHLQLFQGE